MNGLMFFSMFPPNSYSMLGEARVLGLIVSAALDATYLRE